MPRAERKQSSTGIYHMMLRGINKQPIFEEQEDYTRFLTILAEVKKLSGFKLYAYCLMGNHLHMLIKEDGEPLQQIVKRVAARYVFWYNRKYDRSGHLFQDRFRSEPVETDEYLITVLLYIYQNPVKAGICARPAEYQWSSRKTLGSSELVDESELFDIVSIETIKTQERKAIKDELLEPKTGRRLPMTDDNVIAQINEIIGRESEDAFQKLSREGQIRVILELRKMKVSIRQIVRVTGLSKSAVESIVRHAKGA